MSHGDRCQEAQQQIMLAQYGELPDEQQLALERHLRGCEDCRREWNAQLALAEVLALDPVAEPSPNLLAASRMRGEEALEAMPARSAGQGMWASATRWLSLVKGAPALATLLLGVGFFGGNAVTRYQVAWPSNGIVPSERGGAIGCMSALAVAQRQRWTRPASRSSGRHRSRVVACHCRSVPHTVH